MTTFSRVRQNHALEHATVSILSARCPTLTVIGRSDARGFHLYGPVPTELVRQAAEEGLARLQGGEADLAVHPFCGTNSATFGLMAVLFPLLAAGQGPRPARVARGLLGLVLAILAAPAAGLLAQKYITTSPHVAGRSIKSIKRRHVLGMVIHDVEVA